MDIELSKLELIEMLLHTSKESVLSRVRAILEEEQGFVRNDAFMQCLMKEGNSMKEAKGSRLHGRRLSKM